MTGRQCRPHPPVRLPNLSPPKLLVSRGHLAAFLCLHGAPNNHPGTSPSPRTRIRTRRLPAHATSTEKHLRHQKPLEHPRLESLDRRLPLILTHILPRPTRKSVPSRAPGRDVNSPPWIRAPLYDRCQTSPTRQISRKSRALFK